MSETISDEDLTAYVDGEAGGALVNRIEAMLQSDPDLRARLDRLRTNDLALKQAFGALASREPPGRLVEAVHAAAEARAVQPQRVRNRRAALRLSDMFDWLTQRPVVIGWAMAAQAFILIGGAVLLRSPPQPADYHVLSASQSTVRPNALVMFRGDARQDEMMRLLHAREIQIVGGPTDADAYLLRVAPDRLDATMADLRAASIVSLAQPLETGDHQ